MRFDVKTLITSMCLGVALMIYSPFCWGKIAIVTNKDSAVDSLTIDQVKDLFLGSDKFLPNGNRAILADQINDTSLKAEFFKSIANMSLKEITRHWAKIMFTGRGRPPEQIEGDDKAIKSWIVSNLNGVSYINASAVDNSVKVLLILEP